MFGFFGGIILRIEHHRFVAKFGCILFCGLSKNHEPRIIQRGDNDRDFLLVGRSAPIAHSWGRGAVAAHETEDQHDEDFLH